MNERAEEILNAFMGQTAAPVAASPGQAEGQPAENTPPGDGDPGEEGTQALEGDDLQNEEGLGEADGDEEEGEEQGADEPEGETKLTLMGENGEPVQVEIDKILEDTQHEIVVNGEKEFVSYSDLLDGFQRNKDYTQKSQELSREKNELQPYSQMVAYAKEDPAFLTYVQEYFQTGGMGQVPQDLRIGDDQIAALMDSDNDNDRLKARDILGRRAKLNQQMQERQQVNQRVVDQQREMFEKWKAQEDASTKAKIPDYNDQAATEFLIKAGFSTSEASQVYDHRMKVIVDMAMRAMGDGKRKTQTGADSTKTGLKSKRKRSIPPRAVRSGNGRQGTPKAKRQQSNYGKAMKSGNLNDWADVLADRLNL